MLEFSEAPIRWRKSSASGGAAECIEVAAIKNAVLVRDSRNPAGPVISVSLNEWADLLRDLRTTVQCSTREHPVGVSRLKVIK